MTKSQIHILPQAQVEEEDETLRAVQFINELIAS